MTTTEERTYVELDRDDLEELGIDIDWPDIFVDAFRNDEDTITVRYIDQDGGSYLDCPRDDQSGEDAWEWIEFNNGSERDEWRLENSVCQTCREPIEWDYDEDTWVHAEPDPRKIHFPQPSLADTDILIERYEHGLVNYAPIGEASQVDRQWDVAHGVAVIRFTKPETLSPANPDRREALMEFARGICEEYTSWCNGDIYGMVRYERVTEQQGIVPMLAVPVKVWREGDACWGFIGNKYAEEIAKTGDW